VLDGVTAERYAELHAALAFPLLETNFTSWGPLYRGKVRDNYSRPDGTRCIVTTDRISAFDRPLGTLPIKGQMLTRVAAWWFERTRDVAPNHLLEEIDPNALLCTECTPLPVEFVMRGYLTGTTSTSIWVHYERGEREFCGHTLPDGLKQHEKLPEPMLTPSTKAAHGAHDVSASRAEILEITNMPARDFDRAAELAAALFEFGGKVCAERGLVLVDTKYEFGKNRDGEIVLIDEIHTPDSSRFWRAETYPARFAAGLAPESFDKEYLRRYLRAAGFAGDGPTPTIPDEVRVEASARYLAAIETLMGVPFRSTPGDPIVRLEAALGR
jgi:phosphoribosylaminoimidazole-succinocarboxamide synthase